MKIDKRYKKFYEIGNNRYYVLNFDNELYLATENFLGLPKKLFRKKELTQSFKLMELSVPILTLFNSAIDTEIDKKDEEFKDMCTYKKVDNSELRKSINALYKRALEIEIGTLKEDFQRWVADFSIESCGKYTEEEVEDTIRANEMRLEQIIDNVKESHISSRLSTNVPNKKSENDVVKKMLTSGLEFLYSHDINSTMKIYYLYDLDSFGTLTMYKVTCVKEHMKSVATFIYNRELIQDLLAYIENNINN